MTVDRTRTVWPEDRHPANEEAVRFAIAYWLAAPTDTNTDEEDAQLEAVLVEQGVLAPCEVDSFVRGDCWRTLYIKLLDGTSFEISL